MRLQKTIVAAFLSCFAFVAMGQQTTAPLPVSKHGFVVIAHWGGHLVKPENTLAAIEEAIKAEKMYKKIVSLHVPAQYEVYPGEKHGIGGAGRLDVYVKTISWLEKYFPAN